MRQVGLTGTDEEVGRNRRPRAPSGAVDGGNDTLDV
jgi:hypothetical protein